LIDDFETGAPSGTVGWEPFWDASTPTSMNCGTDQSVVHNGSQSLLLDFNIAPDSWGTCGLFFENPQNWSGSSGISFFFQSDQAGLILDIDLYVDGPDGRESYISSFETMPGSVEGWKPVILTWDQFKRVDWEAGAGSRFEKPSQVSGMAFGFSADANTASQGSIWIDDLQLVSSKPDVEDVDSPKPVPEMTVVSEEVPTDDPRGGFPCVGALVLPLGLVGFSYYLKRIKSW
jgi:hypothetical protein